jgi:putative transposase
MITFLRHLLGWIVGVFRFRENLILENLALRQQLLALHAQRPRRRLSLIHKLFWIALPGVWSGWKESLVLVTPRTVVGWHRAGFRLYWRWLSQAKRAGGRTRVSKEVRALIFRMAAENPTWGAPRIHGELLKLGFVLSEPTVSRWLRDAPRTLDPIKRWLTFLRNHREAIAAMDFFTVPTITFWCAVLFFRRRPRAAQDSSFQRHQEPECPLGRAADAGGLAVHLGASLLGVRPRLEVWP